MANNEVFQNLLQQPQPFEIVAQPIATSYVVNVDEEFEHPKQFADLVHVLEQAGENDHVRINLTTVGGALHSVLPLLGAMKDTLAHVHVHIVSDTASAGTFIAMKADSVSINDYVTFMCHNVSFGSGGQGNIVRDHVNYTVDSSDKLLKDIYKGFFTDAEIDKMLSGKEFYMGKDEFLMRQANKEAYEMEQQRKELEALQNPPKQPKKPRKKKVDMNIQDNPFKGLEEAYNLPEGQGLEFVQQVFDMPDKKPETKRKIHPAVKEGSISREEARKAVQSVVNNRK